MMAHLSIGEQAEKPDIRNAIDFEKVTISANLHFDYKLKLTPCTLANVQR